MSKCIFLDRDGVLNKDYVDYVWTIEKLTLLSGVPEALAILKKRGYTLVVITNQSGIAKGVYDYKDVEICHQYIQENTGNCIDAFYYSPYHTTTTNSLVTKPGTLSFERAIAKYSLDVHQCWMVGDMDRDLIPAKKLGIKTILLPHRTPSSPNADFVVDSLLEACSFIP